MIVYLLVGTIMFAEWEGWNYLDSIYFCVTSLTKIGFGDFVPGSSENKILDLNHSKDEEAEVSATSSEVAQIKLVITFVYILLGMAIEAMCYHLLKEEVVLYLRKLKESVSKRTQKVKETFSFTNQ